jgi:hypothetical protein
MKASLSIGHRYHKGAVGSIGDNRSNQGKGTLPPLLGTKETLHAIAGERISLAVTRDDASCPTGRDTREPFHLQPISIRENEIPENGSCPNITRDGDMPSTNNRVFRRILSFPTLSERDESRTVFHTWRSEKSVVLCHTRDGGCDEGKSPHQDAANVEKVHIPQGVCMVSVIIA